MTKWTLPDQHTKNLTSKIRELEAYIERLEQTIKNMTAHIRIDSDE